ncbi:MAG: sulfatase [Verrucomicrobiota bacterium]
MRFSALVVCGISCHLLQAEPGARPNILWLTCEDNNASWVGCYGNPYANTPNIDQLARDGFRYLNCFANAPVCAPSRSTWITGMLAVSNGTFPMRSRNEIPHDQIKYYPDLLKAGGYYVGNDKKTDYNIGGREDSDCWDNTKRVNWEALKANQPFFQVINNTNSHESRAFGDVFQSKHDPKNTRLRAYHPDVPGMRENYAHYHDAMKKMDAGIGAALKKLESMGLAENTIVIHNSDHGGVLPRSKRYLFDTGIHCPLIIRIPEKFKHLYPADQPGMTVDRLVSFVDMPKTWLSITGSEVPDYMQGKIFLGKDMETELDFHFAFRGRMDERMESARALRDKQFLYIRNYMPYVPWMQRLNYLWKMKATQVWQEHVDSGNAAEAQARLFQPKGWTEELYDVTKDPDNINNLIDAPEYAAVAEKMRSELRRMQLKYIDSGLLPESEMMKRAADNAITIHEMVRNPQLYDLPALLDAADLALEQNPSNLPALEQMLAHADSGIRYWAIVGCFLLDHASVAERGMLDDSHEVQAMAAWLAIKAGNQDQGYACLEALIKQQSYAILKVLNIVDWLGADGEKLMHTVRAFPPGDVGRGYPKQMHEYLISKTK